jgi:hypothetical protein
MIAGPKEGGVPGARQSILAVAKENCRDCGTLIPLKAFFDASDFY